MLLMGSAWVSMAVSYHQISAEDRQCLGLVSPVIDITNGVEAGFSLRIVTECPGFIIHCGTHC